MKQWIKNLIDQQRHIQLYLCGPTVYDHLHIGNLRPIIIFDFLIRYFIHKKTSYSLVQNITDIDDKIIHKALQLNVSEQSLSHIFSLQFFDNLQQMGVILPHHFPRVSDHIDYIIQDISNMVELGYAYVVEGDVIFDCSKWAEYGKLSNQSVDCLCNEREIVTTNKKHANDFVLWKKTKIGLVWESPWSHGRPGWHTECFSLIKKYCSSLDIHGGGVDLKFPHHENENIQNVAINKSPITQYWLHVGHVNFNNIKMSKSSNHCFLIKDLLQQYSSNLLRYFFLNTHYSKPINIDYDTFPTLNRELRAFERVVRRCYAVIWLNGISGVVAQESDHKFCEMMENDLDLPNILTYLQSIKNELSKKIKDVLKPDLSFTNELQTFLFVWNALGFIPPKSLNSVEKNMLMAWSQEMNRKNYTSGDEIRKELFNKNIL